jgi:hypothetical protein
VFLTVVNLLLFFRQQKGTQEVKVEDGTGMLYRNVEVTDHIMGDINNPRIHGDNPLKMTLNLYCRLMNYTNLMQLM